MNIDPITPLSLTASYKELETINPSTPSFTHWLTDKVSETNEHLLAADQALQELALGQATSLHQTMLTLEQAKLSFQFMEQIRNRLMSAYQDILREQI